MIYIKFDPMDTKKNAFGFQPENYRLLLIGLAINVVGFLLMIGGGADDPNSFNADELFSARRITIAPLLIVVGYIVIMIAIMKRKKANKGE
jgi:hypothetical protein